MVPLILLFLFLNSSYTGKEVASIRGSCVTGKLSWQNLAGKLSRVNWKKGVVQLEKATSKDIVVIKSLEIEKKRWGERSQLGRAEEKAKGKQHWGPLATMRMDWVMVNSNINSNTKLTPTYFFFRLKEYQFDKNLFGELMDERSWIHAVLNEHNGWVSARYFIHFPLFKILSYPD